MIWTNSEAVAESGWSRQEERNSSADVTGLARGSKNGRPPLNRGLPWWIQQHAGELGGKVSPQAAELLAALIGPDLRLLDVEIDKLLLYVDGRRPVSVEDVRTLVSRAREARVFDLVDCVGRRETAKALKLLHQMLEDESEPLQILGMLGRQIRILIQVSELRSQGLAPPEIANTLKLHPFVVSKALGQVDKFPMAQLEAAHRRVVETDWAIKTGRMDVVLALDLLVITLGAGAARPQEPVFSPSQK
jgi:DNA polymerase-3 subunit delta